jgi:hypothetical protein
LEGPSTYDGCSLGAFDGKEGKMGHSEFGRFRGERGEVGAKDGELSRVVGEEVAHVRARFAVDPATPAGFADAWQAPTGTTEEDESEFVDAVADCLSVGLPIDAAVASWRSGTLEVSGSSGESDDEDDTGVFGDEDATAVYVR